MIILRFLDIIIFIMKIKIFSSDTAVGRSYLRSTAFLWLRGIIILQSRLNAAESVLRGHTGHCRGCFVRCLPTGERIFFFGMKHKRKIVLALRRSYLRFTAFFVQWV